MAYEPLHHKYRPQRFNQLVGQDAIATTLSNALNQRRIAPAYLFCGPRGTGKTSSARILAKSLNCISQDHPTPEPCGTCETCRSITNGSALDFIEIDAASNTGVDNIRELIERAQFAPVQCRYKVYVIDECLTGDSLVLTADGSMRIDDPTIEGKQVLSYNESSQQWEFKRAVRWLNQGVRPIVDIQTTHRRIRCTENHLIRTTEGWIAAGELQAGHRILSPAPVDAAPASLPLAPTADRAALREGSHLNLSQLQTWSFPHPKSLSHGERDFEGGCFRLPSPFGRGAGGEGKSFASQHGLGTEATPTAKSPTVLLDKSRSQLWATNLETVVSVRPAGIEAVYDIEVEDNHNFVANGLLVHNCHMLSTAAFNALLKTLEEPPSNVVFVLATTDPQRVLPTIISRCQRFDYRRIPLEPMILHLRKIATQEAIDINDEALRLVAQVSQGGLRDAQSLLDQLSLLEPPIAADAVWDLVGAVPERDLLALVQAILSDDGSTVLDQARKLMDRGREPLIVLQNLAGFYRDLLIAKTAGGRQDLVAITPPTWAEMQTLVQGLEPSLILMGQQHLRSAEAQVKNTTQPRLWLEVTLLGLLPSALASQVSTSPAMGMAPRPVVPPQPTVPAPERTNTPNAPPPTPTTFTPPPEPPPERSTPDHPTLDQSHSAQPPAAQSPAAQPASTPTQSPESPPLPPPPTNGQGAPVAHADLPHLWAQVIAVLEPLGTRALMLQQGSLVFFDGTVARVGISSRPLFKMAQGRVENVEVAFQKVLNRKVIVSLEVLPDPKPEAPAPNISQAPGQGVSEPHATPYPYPPMEANPAPVVNSTQAMDPTAAVAASAPVSTKGDSTSVASPVASSVASAPVANTMPTMPPLPEIASDFDRAVKNFAQFFNGQVVDIDDDIESLLGGPSPKPSQAAANQPSHPDKDVPF